MNKPIRIQRKRIKGWRMAPNTVYVGRPSKWGNPFSDPTILWSTCDAAVQVYKCMVGTCFLDGFPMVELAKRELRGKNLACWCPLDQPCHADVLLELANEDELRHDNLVHNDELRHEETP